MAGGDRIDNEAADAGPRRLLARLFGAAVAAGRGTERLLAALPPAPAGRTVVIAAGKAAYSMAAAVDAAWPGELAGIAVAPHGYRDGAQHAPRIEFLAAGHPVPDEHSCRAADRALELASGCGAEDLVLVLLSGGASALLAAPPAGITLADKRAVGSALLRCGADIHDMNLVRRQLSRIKGGRLALAAHPARVVTLLVSDVPGDVIADIGSGPTHGDRRTRADARALLSRHGIEVPPAVRQRLAAADDENPGPEDARLAGVRHIVIARPRDALDAAAAAAQAAGYEVVQLGDALTGEARVLGADHARLARRLRGEGRRCCVLSGGETSVTVRGHGRGGRNTEYLLGLLLDLDGAPGITALAADTDGIDGTEHNAGAFADAGSLRRARARGLDAAARLEANDAWGFFTTLGDLFVTGPTHTNVNDFRAILIEP
jgi:glycerate 2-kinase